MIATMVGCFSWNALYVKQMFRDGPLQSALPSPRYLDPVFEAPAVFRELIIERLEAQPQKDLIILQYEPKFFVDRFEWVYNGSDIDGAEVVWARKLSERENERLFAYFKDRQVWLFDPKVKPRRLIRME